jgi:RNA polymerase sigma-70 factor, ECF subfamily
MADRRMPPADDQVASSPDAFGALFDRYRRELQVYCYRLLGSFHEAEDLVQETFERAWRAADRFEAGSSPRPWLYRIATNACLDVLRQRGRRRVLPFDVMDPVRPDQPLPAGAGELWLEPFPDRLLSGIGDDAGADPAETVVHRETIELVFLAAIQHLPARQRVVFIARDVMGWSARATAALLGTSEASVKSALQRARAVMKERLPQRRDDWGAAVEVGDREREVLQRYIGAHQQGDIEALAAVLSEDVRVAYPQIPLWSDSRAAFIQATREFAPPGDYRFVATSANLQPAVGIYHRAPGEPMFRLTALEVLRIEGGEITEIVDFDLPDLYPAFGLAPVLPERFLSGPTVVSTAKAAPGGPGREEPTMTDASTSYDGPDTPTPAADLQALGERLRGAWRVSGGAEGTIRYEWMDGGFFLIQHVELEQYGQQVKGMELIGHLRPFGEPPSPDIHSRFYDSAGNTLDYVYELEGDTLTIWAGEKGSPAYYRGTFAGDGNTLTGEWVYPGGGGYRSTSTRIDG